MSGKSPDTLRFPRWETERETVASHLKTNHLFQSIDCPGGERFKKSTCN